MRLGIAHQIKGWTEVVINNNNITIPKSLPNTMDLWLWNDKIKFTSDHNSAEYNINYIRYSFVLDINSVICTIKISITSNILFKFKDEDQGNK